MLSVLKNARFGEGVRRECRTSVRQAAAAARHCLRGRADSGGGGTARLLGTAHRQSGRRGVLERWSDGVVGQRSKKVAAVAPAHKKGLTRRGLAGAGASGQRLIPSAPWSAKR